MGTVVYTTCQSNVLWCTQNYFLRTPGYTKRQLLPANRVGRFYESNESMIQIIEMIGKYISLCNSFALSCIKFTFAVDPPWDAGTAMATRVKPQ